MDYIGFLTYNLTANRIQKLVEYARHLHEMLPRVTLPLCKPERCGRTQ